MATGRDAFSPFCLEFRLTEYPNSITVYNTLQHGTATQASRVACLSTRVLLDFHCWLSLLIFTLGLRSRLILSTSTFVFTLDTSPCLPLQWNIYHCSLTYLCRSYRVSKSPWSLLLHLLLAQWHLPPLLVDTHGTVGAATTTQTRKARDKSSHPQKCCFNDPGGPWPRYSCNHPDRTVAIADYLIATSCSRLLPAPISRRSS